jgi:hypothetical protein
MCWWNDTSPLPCDLDSFSWLWRTVGVIVHVTFLIYLHVCILNRCFMALVRGTGSDFPCPICLVPNTQMYDGSTHPLRTSDNMQKIYNEPAAIQSKTQQEKLLKKYSLRNVKVWEAHNSGIDSWLNFKSYRISSGVFRIQIPTKPYHLIVCMQTILVCLRTTCGMKQRSWLWQKDGQHWVRLMISKCDLYQSLIPYLYHSQELWVFLGGVDFTTSAMVLWQ